MTENGASCQHCWLIRCITKAVSGLLLCILFVWLAVGLRADRYGLVVAVLGGSGLFALLYGAWYGYRRFLRG